MGVGFRNDQFLLTFRREEIYLSTGKTDRNVDNFLTLPGMDAMVWMKAPIANPHTLPDCVFQGVKDLVSIQLVLEDKPPDNPLVMEFFQFIPILVPASHLAGVKGKQLYVFCFLK